MFGYHTGRNGALRKRCADVGHKKRRGDSNKRYRNNDFNKRKSAFIYLYHGTYPVKGVIVIVTVAPLPLAGLTVIACSRPMSFPNKLNTEFRDYQKIL